MANVTEELKTDSVILLGQKYGFNGILNKGFVSLASSLHCMTHTENTSPFSEAEFYYRVI